MSGSSFKEVTRQSWFGRMGSSFKGVIAGCLLLAAAIYLLVWNEGRAVTEAKSLEEGAASVVHIAPDKVSPAHDQQLVHTSGTATTSDVLKDPLFGVAAIAIKLKRHVEIYQWQENELKETRNKPGGGTETTTKYEYNKVWSDSLIPTSKFKIPEGHQNPMKKEFDDWAATAEQVSIGKFTLSSGLLEHMHNFEPLPVSDQDLKNVSADLKSRLTVYRGQFYESKSPADNPQVGDIRIEFQVVKPTTVSLIARQTAETFSPYHTKSGRQIQMLEVGEHSAQTMFGKAMQESSRLTWMLRLTGFLATSLGFLLLFQPIATLAKAVPFLGDLLGWGVGPFSVCLGAILSLVTIALGWLSFSPVRGILLFAAAAAVLFVLARTGRKRRTR